MIKMASESRKSLIFEDSVNQVRYYIEQKLIVMNGMIYNYNDNVEIEHLFVNVKKFGRIDIFKALEKATTEYLKLWIESNSNYPVINSKFLLITKKILMLLQLKLFITN
jgi:hypothetical protein